jgi:hypothetical protein
MLTIVMIYILIVPMETYLVIVIRKGMGAVFFRRPGLVLCQGVGNANSVVKVCSKKIRKRTLARRLKQCYR